MYTEEKIPPKRAKSSTSNYYINPVGVLMFLAKIFYYGVLLFAPFLLWKVLGLEQIIGRYEAFFYLALYALMAQEFIRHPSRFILRGAPWNEKVMIQRTIYEQADNCDDHGRIHFND